MAAGYAFAMTFDGDSLIGRDLRVLWHPCSQMRDYVDFPPLHVVSAEGCRLTLADGRQILDAISSWWCKSLGHGHPALRAAMVQQADRFEHVILANTTNVPVVRLCERLLAAANGYASDAWGPTAAEGRRQGHFGKVFLADNGSTAVEIALKMALQAQAQRGQPERRLFAALSNGYHGETLGAMSVSDLGLYSQPYEPLLFKALKLAPIPYRSGRGDPCWNECDEEWHALESQLDEVADTLAAIIYEPVLQAAGGMRLYSPALLGHLREWADAHEVFLIADEIASGVFRLGPFLASHLANGPVPGVAALTGALPDFALLSKGLTGGFMPLSAVLTTDVIYDLFYDDYLSRRAFLHSNTYTGNALAVAVANATLDVFADQDLQTIIEGSSRLLRSLLDDLCRSHPYLRHPRSLGMVAAVDIRRSDGHALDARDRTGYHVYQEAVRRGALLRPLGDTMYLFPPLNTAALDLRAMVQVLGESLGTVCG